MASLYLSAVWTVLLLMSCHAFLPPFQSGRRDLAGSYTQTLVSWVDQPVTASPFLERGKGKRLSCSKGPFETEDVSNERLPLTLKIPKVDESISFRLYEDADEDEEEYGDEEDGKESRDPQTYFNDLAIMAAQAAEMPMDFFNQPGLAYYKLGGEMDTCRLIVGTWQLDGKHGYHPFFLDVKDAVYDIVRTEGYTTFDVAPFYGQVERWLGDVRSRIEDPLELDLYKIFTKMVFPPILDQTVSLPEVEAKVDSSLRQLRTLRLDLVQLHWWDFNDTRYLDALHYLHELQGKGKVRHIGVTNFDVEPLRQVVENRLPVVSNSVQFSILDQRPLANLTTFCVENNITLLCYGALLGGFLTDRWLGEKAPNPRGFSSSSEEKYFEMIRAWGGWDQFQELLKELYAIARKHKSCIAHVALRWVLDQPAVGSVVIGTRIGFVDHLKDNKEVLKLKLTANDCENIASAALLGRNLSQVLGPVGIEYQRAVLDSP